VRKHFSSFKKEVIMPYEIQQYAIGRGWRNEWFYDEGDGVTRADNALSEGVELVVLDMMVPGRSGLEVLARLRKQSPARRGSRASAPSAGSHRGGQCVSCLPLTGSGTATDVDTRLLPRPGNDPTCWSGA